MRIYCNIILARFANMIIADKKIGESLLQITKMNGAICGFVTIDFYEIWNYIAKKQQIVA